MMRSRNVAAALTGDGTSIELVDYQWTGDWVEQHENGVHTLSRLIAPSKLVEHWTLGGCKVVRGNSLAFIPAKVPVGFLPEQTKGRFGVCQFSRDRFNAVTSTNRSWDTIDFQLCGDIRSPLLDRVIHRLIQEAISPGLACDVLVESLSAVAMIELTRHLDDVRQRCERVRGGLSPWQVRRITDYVENRTDAPVRVSDLAQLCEISEGHLQRAFKQSSGRTLHAYVEDVRLERAKAMLEDPNISIVGIAAKLGFANASGFSIAFRRASGEAPTTYRRRLSRRSPA